jgi:hypothetical protein
VKAPTVSYRTLVKLGACAQGREAYREALGARAVDVGHAAAVMSTVYGASGVSWVAWYAERARPAAIRTLSASPEIPVRVACAVAKRCPPDVLRTLAADIDDNVRWGAAGHPRCPVSVLRTLRDTDPDVYVKERAARTLRDRV